MEKTIFDKGGADDYLQAQDFAERGLKFLRNVQQLMAQNEQLRQQVAEQDEKNEKQAETINQLTGKEIKITVINHFNFIPAIRIKAIIIHIITTTEPKSLVR